MKLYLPPGVTEKTNSQELFISSATVHEDGIYDCVRIWMRGKMSGLMLMDVGDGEAFLKLLGLEPHDCPRCGRAHETPDPKPEGTP